MGKIKLVIGQLRNWFQIWAKERLLKRNGWEKFQGKWIHVSGQNKYMLTREQALEANRTSWEMT